jgi:DNA polymerase
LYRHATQAVLGEGPPAARIVMVGEQPGDREDLAGRPFVGSAGALLDRALADAGSPRAEAYLTNAVKHFKFEERGKRRIHKKPSIAEIDACLPWLSAELLCIRPRIVVCLGATAARALIGAKHSVTSERGRLFTHPQFGNVTITVHPSAILRVPDPDQRHAAYRHFVEDLKSARQKTSKRAVAH